MVGTWVEFPTSFASWDIGIVTHYDESTGQITVRSEDGEVFIGCESLVTNIDVS